MSREEIRQPTLWYTIVGGGFRTQVSQDDPHAVRRDWKSADGSKTGTKYERIVDALIGYVSDIQFFDGEYGLQLIVSLDADEQGRVPKIALNAGSREGESLLKRLPAVDFAKEVRLRPFSFKDNQDGSEIKGIEVTQPDENGEFTIKVKNFFRDEEAKVNINGYPDPGGDTNDYSKDDWKIYFLQCRKFLVDYTKINVMARLAVTDRPAPKPSTVDYPADEPNPDDIPF